MLDEWYFQVQGDVHGPVTRDELARLAHSGAFGLNDQVRAGPTGAWVRPSTSLFPAGLVMMHEDARANRAWHPPPAITGFADNHFGELLVRRRGNITHGATFFGCIALLAALIAAFSMMPASGKPDWLVTFGAALVAAVAAFLFARCLGNSRTVVYVHERGVIQRGPGGEVRLAYADVDSLTWEVTRHWAYFLIYQGSELEFKVIGKGGQRMRLLTKYEEYRGVAGGSGRKIFENVDPLNELRVRVYAASEAAR